VLSLAVTCAPSGTTAVGAALFALIFLVVCGIGQHLLQKTKDQEAKLKRLKDSLMVEEGYTPRLGSYYLVSLDQGRNWYQAKPNDVGGYHCLEQASGNLVAQIRATQTLRWLQGKGDSIDPQNSYHATLLEVADLTIDQAQRLAR
jgi:hypothetical protein